MYTHARVCAHMHAHVCIHMYMCLHMYMCRCIYVCVHVRVPMWKCPCPCISVCVPLLSSLLIFDPAWFLLMLYFIFIDKTVSSYKMQSVFVRLLYSYHLENEQLSYIKEHSNISSASLSQTSKKKTSVLV